MAYEPASLPSLALVGGFSAPGGLTHPVLVAASGTYSLSGQTTQAFKGRRLTADFGTYSITGSSSTTDYHMVALGSSYAITGLPVGLTASQRRIFANPGAYTYTGFPVSLVAVDRVLTLQPEAGVYTLNTFSVDFTIPAIATGVKVKQRTFVYAGPATVTATATVAHEVEISNSTPDVFFLGGTADSEDVSGYALGTGTLYYTVSTGALAADVNLATDGILTYGGTGGPSVSRISIRSDAVQTGDRFEISEIPELVFIEGIAETEELGVYQLDPDNLWTPGDLTNVSGWSAMRPCALDVGGDAWLTYSQASGRLTYTGAAITGATKDYTATLSGNGASRTFRIRILRPTHVYGFASAPGDKIAEHSWTSALAIDAATVPWGGSAAADNGPCRIGTKGRTENDPRVIFMCGQTFPTPAGMTWVMQPTNSPAVNDTTYVYVLGDPDTRPLLTKSGSPGRLTIRSVCTRWVLKNLRLNNIAIFNDSPTSDRKHQTILHKIDQQNTISQSPGDDCIGSSATYLPFTYPGPTQVDATDGSLGTYYHTYVTFFTGISNGSTGNTLHQMYQEGNGASATFVNASLFAGARGCSTLKSIQMGLKVRNSLLSVAPDYDTFASAASPATVPWADAIVDFKGTGEFVAFNNEFRVGMRPATGSQTAGTRAGMFFRRRNTSMGGDVPPYPAVNWNPPLGGAGHTAIPGFPQGAATFADDNFWAAVASYDITSPDNPYSFKRYISHSKFRLMSGTIGAVTRDDGTHPSEAAPEQFSTSAILGTHPDWIERAVAFHANNQFLGAYLSTMSERYNNDATDAPTGREDGTGNITQSFFVTWNDGTTGYVRVNYLGSIDKVRGWSAALDSRITALPQAGSTTGTSTFLNPPAWGPATNPNSVQSRIVAQVAQPLYPSAKFNFSGTTHSGPSLPTAVEVGGISFPDAPATPIDLPPWFLI